VKFVYLSALALAGLTACSHGNVDSLEAVKQGVIRDISKNVNIGAMDVNVVSVSFRDKEADAVVSFAPKGGTAAQGLTMNYTMERQGSEWHIKKRAQSDLQKHAAQASPGAMGGAPEAGTGALPPGHPATPGGSDPQALPPGHPPMTEGSQSQTLPPGHPPLKK
jgi:hypothetical protein